MPARDATEQGHRVIAPHEAWPSKHGKDLLPSQASGRCFLIHRKLYIDERTTSSHDIPQGLETSCTFPPSPNHTHVRTPCSSSRDHNLNPPHPARPRSRIAYHHEVPPHRDGRGDGQNAGPTLNLVASSARGTTAVRSPRLAPPRWQIDVPRLPLGRDRWRSAPFRASSLGCLPRTTSAAHRREVRPRPAGRERFQARMVWCVHRSCL